MKITPLFTNFYLIWREINQFITLWIKRMDILCNAGHRKNDDICVYLTPSLLIKYVQIISNTNYHHCWLVFPSHSLTRKIYICENIAEAIPMRVSKWHQYCARRLLSELVQTLYTVLSTCMYIGGCLTELHPNKNGLFENLFDFTKHL
jgi:hypothetical protein